MWYIILVFFSFLTALASEKSCYVHFSGFSIDQYNPYANTSFISFSNLKVSCLKPKRGVIKIKIFTKNGSNPRRRFLYSASTKSKLYYNLYYRNCILGDGSGYTCVITIPICKKSKRIVEFNIPIKIKVFPHQNVSAASDYKDSIVVILDE